MLTTRHYSHPMAASTREINRSLLPSAKTRATIAKRLAGVTGKMATATVAEMEARYHWFRRLDAEHRSWITLVAQAGIDGFVRWFAAPGPQAPSTSEVFGSAPRELARKISPINRGVVRTTIEGGSQSMSSCERRRPILLWRSTSTPALPVRQRDLRAAAELRGPGRAAGRAVVDAGPLANRRDRGVAASTLGWHSTAGVVVVVGPAPQWSTRRPGN